MLEHIVKNEETILDILSMYHLELEELKYVNLHITDFNHIQPGMKIKIPFLNNEVEQVLEKTEGFVMNYYPKVEETIRVFEEEELPVKQSLVETRKQEAFTQAPKEEDKISRERGRAYPGILPPKNRTTRN